jgi:hypothetical protein
MTAECIERINERRHSRFGVSRRERFETMERSALKPLPVGDIDCAEWKEATLHPDCYVYVEGDYYSAPHIHRHKKLRIKITENQVEIFLRLERLAIHPRCRHRNGQRIKIASHFPPASQAYYEATPLEGREAAADLIEDWDLDLAECQAGAGRPQGRPAPELVHKLVFSMPAGTPADKVLRATQAFCREQWALKHRYAMALHTDEPHPHVHVIVKAVSEQGERHPAGARDAAGARAWLARHERGAEKPGGDYPRRRGPALCPKLAAREDGAGMAEGGAHRPGAASARAASGAGAVTIRLSGTDFRVSRNAKVRRPSDSDARLFHQSRHPTHSRNVDHGTHALDGRPAQFARGATFQPACLRLGLIYTYIIKY